MHHPEFVHDYVKRFCEISANGKNPAKLYRYRSCAKPFFEEELERLLAKHEVYFPSQLQLNDPFDCLPVFEKGISFDGFHQYLHPVICAIRTEMARELSPLEFSPPEMAEIVKHNTATEPASAVREIYDARFDRMISDMFATIGILSLTTCLDNMVMWSMYGDRGNGICIELENLAYEFRDHGIMPVQVHYETHRPVFNYLGAAAVFLDMTRNAAQYVNREALNLLLDNLHQARYAWTKQERWRYEGEYRLIAYKSGGRYLNMEPARVAALYLGYNVSTKIRERITSIVRAHDLPIAIYAGRMSNRTYSVQFDLLT